MTDKALFPLGRVVATVSALQALEKAGESSEVYLRRHASGDWGELDGRERKKNGYSLEFGWRLRSIYTLSTGVKIWVITKADRSATTVLLPGDYWR